MGDKKVILGLYSQKPLGTHKEDLEFALNHCYKPLLTFLYTNEHICFSLYFSGMILEWLESEHPEINMLIHDMVKRKQLELLAGGFYDPLFTILPSKDRSRQAEMSITYLRKRFGIRPKTFWITDQVWSPNIITTLSGCGIKRILVHTQDGERSSSFVRKYPFIMQEMGRTIEVFPICKKSTEELTRKSGRWLNELLHDDRQQALYTIMLDANKLISTNILEKETALIGMLEKAFHDLDKHTIDTVLPEKASNYLLENPSRAYLPAGCYRQNGLPVGINDYNEKFIQYPELNFLYGRLCYSQTLSLTIKKEKGLKKLVMLEILKGESFGAFTHSDWGGIYQNNLRKENYLHLIEAEKTAREKGLFTSSLTAFDFDFDTIDEFIYRGKNITAVVDQKGGSLAELDYLVTSWNYIDTFVGRAGDAEETAQKLHFTRRKQNCFFDVILDPDTDTAEYEKYNGNKVQTLESVSYSIEKIDKVNRGIKFSHIFSYSTAHHTSAGMQLTKTYSLGTNNIEVQYEIKNTNDNKVSFKFGSEQNISFAYDGDGFVEFNAVDSQHTRKIGDGRISMFNVKKLEIRDSFKKTLLTLSSDKRFTIYKNSYNTQLSNLYGEEEIYQHTVLVPIWDVHIQPGEEWTTKLDLRIEKIKK